MTGVLRALVASDQFERELLPPEPTQAQLRALYERDRERRRAVRAALDEGRCTTARDWLDAAIVLHHGDAVEEHACAHALATAAAFARVDEARWWSTAALDRLLVRLGRK